MVAVPASFSLARTCAPVWWSRGRLPDLEWSGGLVWVGHGPDHLARRRAMVVDGRLHVTGDAPESDAAWAREVLGVRALARLGDDPNIARLAARHPGTHPFAYGSLYAGLLTSIIGQGVSVAAAATFQARLARSLSPPVSVAGDDRQYWPLPSAHDLAAADPAAVRTCGVTGRRAAALVALARHAADGDLPATSVALADPVATEVMLRELPLVGPWTARSALLWGIGADDAFPPGDAALLRAARHAYDDDGLDQRTLERLSDGWRPARARAARLLWLDLLGTPPEHGPDERP